MVKIEGTEEEIRSLLGFDGVKPRKTRSTRKNPRHQVSSLKAKRPKKKGKPMSRKTQLAINRGRKKAGLKPIKWKKKGR